MEKIIAVIIAKDEQRAIKRTLRILNVFKAKGLIHDIVVVNDGSKDMTARVAERYGATVVSHLKNEGKRQAFIVGASTAKRMGATIMLSLDADIIKFPETTLRKMIDTVRNPRKTLMATAQQYERIWPFEFRVGGIGINLGSKAIRAIHMQALDPLFKAQGRWLDLMCASQGVRYKDLSMGEIQRANKWGLETALEMLVPKNKKKELVDKVVTRAPYFKSIFFHPNAQMDARLMLKEKQRERSIHAENIAKGAGKRKLIRAIQAPARRWGK